MFSGSPTPPMSRPGPRPLRRFVIDAYAQRIVGWRVSPTAHAGFVLDAPEQALHDDGQSIAAA
jgi:transposase InsO family protein